MSTSGGVTAGSVTAAAIEATFTASSQLYVGTGVGTGVLSNATTGNPVVNSLGVGVAASGVQGVIECTGIGVGYGAAPNNQFIVGIGTTAYFLGNVNLETVLVYAAVGAGINTSAAAAVTTPTLGAAAQLAQTTKDVMLYIVVGTAGTLTIAIGPTSGVANTIVAGLAVPLGAMYSIRLPAGWFVAVSSGTTATWTTTAIVC